MSTGRTVAMSGAALADDSVGPQKLTFIPASPGIVEVDLGATPVAEATVTVTDAEVTTASCIVAQVAYVAPTGKDLDEIEVDDIVCRCAPGTGQFDVLLRAADGSYLADKFVLHYFRG